jgi:serine/threonine-protein kinase
MLVIFRILMLELLLSRISIGVYLGKLLSGSSLERQIVMGGNFGDLTGQTFGTCTLVKPLGQGGMGAVYLARQMRPSRNVAVKILHASYTLDDPLSHEFLARFQREADVIARLEHINIMPIYEYGEQNNSPYLVMPYLTGGSLRDLLNRYGSLSLTNATTYIEQAASALDYAHSHGVIHRDLKPANFLLHGDGRLVLADFGIARIIDNSDSGISALTHTGTIVGTPDYMAPEMAQGDPLDYRVDIYELGIVLYQMLTGHVPFTGSSPYAIVIQHIQNALPLIHVSNPGIPPAVDEVLQKATAKLPAARFATAGAMALALRQAIRGVASQAQTVLDQQPVVRTNLPISTTPVQPLQESHQAIEEQQQSSVAPPVAADQAPVKMSASSSLPTEQAQSVSTLVPDQHQSAASPLTLQTPVGTKSNRRWLVLIVALVILIGGGLLGTALLRNSAQQNGNGTPGAPTTGKSPTVNTPTALSKGAELYSTTMPAPSPCNKAGDDWKALSGGFDCYSAPVHIQGRLGAKQLGGMLLNQLPRGQSYPSDYVVQAHVQSLRDSAFGIYFRNQPGSLQMKTYTFLVFPDETWQASVYDGKGEPRQLVSGKQTVSSANAWMTLAVVVKGSNFSFYINDTLVGKVQDSTYPSGTAGIAVGHDGEIITDQFSLYSVTP